MMGVPMYYELLYEANDAVFSVIILNLGVISNFYLFSYQMELRTHISAQ